MAADTAPQEPQDSSTTSQRLARSLIHATDRRATTTLHVYNDITHRHSLSLYSQITASHTATRIARMHHHGARARRIYRPQPAGALDLLDEDLELLGRGLHARAAQHAASAARRAGLLDNG